MISSNSLRAPIFLVLLLFISTLNSIGQIPTGIDAGQSDDAVNIYQQPEYIIPILTLFVILIGFFFWRKRNKK